MVSARGYIQRPLPSVYKAMGALAANRGERGKCEGLCCWRTATRVSWLLASLDTAPWASYTRKYCTGTYSAWPAVGWASILRRTSRFFFLHAGVDRQWWSLG